MHGVPYSGPNWSAEMAEAEKVLAGRKTMVQYLILRQINNGKLILWDGPGLKRREADGCLKIWQKEYPKEKFFVYKEDRNVE